MRTGARRGLVGVQLEDAARRPVEDDRHHHHAVVGGAGRGAHLHLAGAPGQLGEPRERVGPGAGPRGGQADRPQHGGFVRGDPVADEHRHRLPAAVAPQRLARGVQGLVEPVGAVGGLRDLLQHQQPVTGLAGVGGGLDQVGDVVDHPPHPQTLAGPAHVDDAEPAQPAQLAVLAVAAGLPLEGVTDLEVGAEVVDDRLAVRRMEQGQGRGERGLELARLEPGDAEQLVGPGHRLGAGHPLPAGHPGDLVDVGQLATPLPALLAQPPTARVLGEPVPAAGPAVGQDEGSPRGQGPHLGPVGPGQQQVEVRATSSALPHVLEVLVPAAVRGLGQSGGEIDGRHRLDRHVQERGSGGVGVDGAALAVEDGDGVAAGLDEPRQHRLERTAAQGVVLRGHRAPPGPS